MDFSKFNPSSKPLMGIVMASILSATALADGTDDYSWTTDDTESHWEMLVAASTQTSTTPRFAAASEERGEGVLETFGTQYLPNAYACYQEVRATAKEREQVLQENFPEGRASDTTGGALYDKVQKACAKSVAEMFRRHDELCHYLLLYRMGAVSDQDLADLDTTRISVVLPDEAAPPAVYDRPAPVLAQAEIDFATKYLPETRVAFQRLDSAFSEGVKAYGEWRETALLVDATRSDALFQPLRERLDGIHGQLDEIVRMVKEKKLLHAVGEASASALADADREKGLSVQQFEKGLSVGPIVGSHVRVVVEEIKKPLLTIKGIIASMVQIPGWNYKMGKYEVTQTQWATVMGRNPSFFKGEDNPVEDMSWDDCQEFLRRLNALPAVQESGLTFRLPTRAEWEYACRAGATGKYCKLANGTEITESTLGQVAWFGESVFSEPHQVGKKEPNAFGLYDMHGNVWEWTQTAHGECREICGGSWWEGAGSCESSHKQWNILDGSRSIGFRLCAVDSLVYEVEQNYQAAERGNAEAQWRLGDMYKSGRGVEQDDIEAVAWYRKAADQGNPEAQARLGWMAAFGRGMERNDAEAVSWYRKAADQGHAEAQWRLGDMYESGRGVERNDVEAVAWYRKAADQGLALAQWSLGNVYRFGCGVERNDAEAVAWYRRAADQGLAYAQLSLGFMYQFGWGVERNDVEAVAWYRKAAEQGLAGAQHSLGTMYQFGRGVERNDAEAVAWYRKASDQGNDMAQFLLGNMYRSGRGVEKDDAEAVAWYRKAADQGLAFAQRSLGDMYKSGRGVEKDDAEAVAWYRKAADRGNAEAQCRLGWMAAFGRGMERNEALAASWFHKAVEQGYEPALAAWGHCLKFGIGVERNEAESEHCFAQVKDVATSFNSLAWGLFENARPDQALPYAEKAVAAIRENMSHERRINVLCTLAAVLDKLNKAAEAKAVCEEVLVLFPEDDESDNYETALVWLGRACRRLGDADGAVDAFRKALVLVKKHGKPAELGESAESLQTWISQLEDKQ